MLRVRPSALLAGIAMLAVAEPARPCSLSGPSVTGTVTPSDGALLPVNGAMYARLRTQGLTPTASLRADTELTGRNVDVDDVGEAVRINLDDLRPATSYSLTLSISDEVGPDDELTRRTLHFTTTSRPDTEAPRFLGDGDVAVAVEHRRAGDAPDPCGDPPPAATNRIAIALPVVDDDFGAAGVKLFRRNPDGTRELRALGLEINRDDSAFHIEETNAGDYVYELVAVDFAGNESAPLVVDVHVDEAPIGCSAAGPASLSSFGAVMILSMLRRARHARMKS